MDALEITDTDGFFESVKVFRGDLYLGQVIGGVFFWEEKQYEIWQSPCQSYELRREATSLPSSLRCPADMVTSKALHDFHT
ncbi:unnamed protein product [Symbiodinium sp. CCMP2592]|nr:unnamed protein product [Symbiodinium sp. CCMP2592]